MADNIAPSSRWQKIIKMITKHNDHYVSYFMKVVVKIYQAKLKISNKCISYAPNSMQQIFKMVQIVA